ncbi:MAG: hypothetical protein M1830_008830 [Pleopsidium flavum]|nr:MAG: hypothetical protein M1830_008830 [Pleopsidium flavum]
MPVGRSSPLLLRDQEDTGPLAATLEPSTSRHSFTSFPPEIRNEVYRYLLSLEPHTSIIYTNRLIAQEATAILYSENTITAPIKYKNNLFRMEEPSNNNEEKHLIAQGNRDTRSKSDILSNITKHTGLLYPHTLLRVRHLKLDVEFSCCSRQGEFQQWNFHSEWVATALKKTIKLLSQGGILEELILEVHISTIAGGEVPGSDAVNITLEPFRDMKNMKDVKIVGPDRCLDMLFVAKLIWDMMGSCDGGD